jgi:hypothetical protein
MFVYHNATIGKVIRCYINNASLHYVLPALQFICACLIFMNMYVLLVAVCKCIVCFYVIFIYVGSKAKAQNKAHK